MSPSPSLNDPWPQQTAPPASYPSGSKRKRQQTTVITNQTAVDAAETACTYYSGNGAVTCYPDAGDLAYQHQWAAVVWNSNRPQLTQYNIVNLYLMDADTQVPVVNVTGLTNPYRTAGTHNVYVNDTLFGDRGATWQPGGGDLNYTFFWIVTNQDGLDGSATTNPTFTAVQTTYADSIAASMSSSASLAAASSASLLSSQSVASLSSLGITQSPTPSGNVQGNSASPPFPHWAIAVIVVLGFFAILAGGIMVWLIMRRLRRRERASQRGSMGSSSPMMANAQNPNSPQLPLLAGGVAAGRASSEHHRPGSTVSPDGVSEISRAHSNLDSGPFSGADAAIMANAFRDALRKPDFGGAPVEEGDTPETAEERKDEIMNRELAEEGRDIRSVGSSRGVRVETLSDAGDTVQEH
ncbi:hypothetical protein BJ138DRAFT_1135779 [Hygrophoropsis aurantiaca]|uniref:Uncharacterized protein n=1 Tax=Hygrophoropsis aurantiaca TaxID=72124 RepID=A0ACB8AC73_9AGAM|nr:hypothetical protein BJ138DRAFT_1135779 [Hygrophoropsis aurantiaca]